MPMLSVGARLSRPSFLTAIFSFTALAWFNVAGAVTLGSPQLISKPGEPFRTEIPLLLLPDELPLVELMKAEVPSSATFERFSISNRVLELKPQASIRQAKTATGQTQYQILIQSDRALSDSQEPFLDLLVQLSWPSGSLTKVYSLLVGDAQKVVVRPGQTLSEIALQMAPQLGGASLDETLLALYKANPDAFVGGSIHRLNAGAELYKPSQALLQSITPTAAKTFAAKNNDAWLDLKTSAEASPTKSPDPNLSNASKDLKNNKNSTDELIQDRLKIGPGIGDGAEQRRFQEDLVAQEQALLLIRARAAELEKNIADLQILLEQQAGQQGAQQRVQLGVKQGVEQGGQQGVKQAALTWPPVALALSLLGLTGALFWLLARYTRRAEMIQPDLANLAASHLIKQGSKATTQSVARSTSQSTDQADAQNIVSKNLALPEIPARAKVLFAGLNLDLNTPTPTEQTKPEQTDLAQTKPSDERN